MDLNRLFEVIKESLIPTYNEFNSNEVSEMILIFQNDPIKFYSTSEEKNKGSESILFAQAWRFIVQILQNELYLEIWNSISIKGRNKTVTIFSLGFNFNSILLMIQHSSSFDPSEVIKILLKFVFSQNYSDKFDTVGLIASEGFPVWINFPNDREMDEFLFAISVTSLLSLVERIDMEVQAGGVLSCRIQGTDSLLLSVMFNPSQDLALTVTQKGSNFHDFSIKPELEEIYKKIVNPILFSISIPEIKDEDREKMLLEIHQEFEGELTDEELDTLSIFDTKTLDALRNEILSIAKKYRVNEISIGYLRKRMQLPQEVLLMALEYLIANDSIKGRIGQSKKSGMKILVLDPISERTPDENEQLKQIQLQIDDLFSPINKFLIQIPTTEISTIAIQEIISEALSEFQVIKNLSDTDPLFVLFNDMRINGFQIENSLKAMQLLQKQLGDTLDDSVARIELQKRLKILEKKLLDQHNIIRAKSKAFQEDLMNAYRLILRLLPSPAELFITSKAIYNDIFEIIFSCSAHNCDESIKIHDLPNKWIKLSIFSKILEIKEDLPEFSNKTISQLIVNYESLLDKLTTCKNSETFELKYEKYNYLEKIGELILSNDQIDEAISRLKQIVIENTEITGDFYTMFNQCISCYRWYCVKKNHIASTSKCIYCS